MLKNLCSDVVCFLSIYVKKQQNQLIESQWKNNYRRINVSWTCVSNCFCKQLLGQDMTFQALWSLMTAVNISNISKWLLKYFLLSDEFRNAAFEQTALMSSDLFFYSVSSDFHPLQKRAIHLIYKFRFSYIKAFLKAHFMNLLKKQMRLIH